MAKITGRTKEGFILEISSDEVSNLIGYYSQYRDRGEPPAPDIGDTINIAKMYRHLRELSSGNAEIRKTATKLRLSADLIDQLPDPLTKADAMPDKI